jgi:hypothetical protein
MDSRDFKPLISNGKLRPFISSGDLKRSTCGGELRPGGELTGADKPRPWSGDLRPPRPLISSGGDLEPSISRDLNRDLSSPNGHLGSSSKEEEEEEEEEKKEEVSCSKKCCPRMMQNWKKIIVVVFLWIAYFMCRAAFSNIAPFFPLIVGDNYVAI